MNAMDVARVERSSGASLGWWGTVWLIATEGMIFAILLFGNFFLRAQSGSWPQGDIEEPELLVSGIRSVILISSSLPMHVGERAIRDGKRPRMLWTLALGWLMGAVFLVGHVDEYRNLWEEFRPSTNAYGSAFYTITGFHAAHLTGGLIVIAYVWVRGLLGRYDANDYGPVQNSVLYWHFVDVVWVFVYASLYLSVTWS